MSVPARSLAVLAAASVVLALAAFRAAASPSQPVPTSSSTTAAPTTTTPPPSLPSLTSTSTSTTTSTTTPPPTDGGNPPATLPPSSDTPPPGAGPDTGDTGSPPPSGQSIPGWAQRAMNAVVRTPPNDDLGLVRGEQALEAEGVAHDEAVRLAYGRFPVAGVGRWHDDWLDPRWGSSGFRFHLGCDIAAAYGTPVRAPVDGVARIGDEPLGGLAVTVVQADGISFYMAHLSGLAPGLAEGTPVTTGEIVGFVGQSGDATAPHLHFGIRNAAGVPAAPKPVLDRWVADAEARLPDLLARFRPAAAATPRPLVATAAVRAVADAARTGDVAPPSTPSQTELVWAAAANPAGGPLQMAEAEAADAAGRIDWHARAADQAALDARLRDLARAARAITAPLTPRALWPLLD